MCLENVSVSYWINNNVHKLYKFIIAIIVIVLTIFHFCI